MDTGIRSSRAVYGNVASKKLMKPALDLALDRAAFGMIPLCLPAGEISAVVFDEKSELQKIEN